MNISDFSIKSSEEFLQNKKKINFKLPKNSKFILVDKQDRKILGEGRNYGVGFAFAKRNGKIIETAYPISPCREYLNDQLGSELTGRKFSAYGCYASKKNLLDDGFGYLVFGVMKQGPQNPHEYDNYKRDYNALNSNYKNVQILLNKFEEKLGIPERSEIFFLEENRFLAVVPKFWCETTYRISLYTLIVRSGIFYKEGEPDEFLFTCKKDYDDSMQINSAKTKIERLLGGERDVQNLKNVTSIHGSGIVNAKI